MENNTYSLNSFGDGQGKDKQFRAQLKRVYEAFKVKPMTMKEVDVYTGIMRENICRYVSQLLELGLIAISKKRRCSITGYPKVNEYTGKNLLAVSWRFCGITCFDGRSVVRRCHYVGCSLPVSLPVVARLDSRWFPCGNCFRLSGRVCDAI